MDFLLKKSDGSTTDLKGTVTRLQLPDSTDTIFPGDTRPVDLGDYVLVKAIEVTEEVTSGKKRGDTTVAGDKDKETVTVTHTAVDQSDDEQWAEIRASRDIKLMATDHYALSDVTMADNMKTYRQALRDLPASESDPDDITFPTEPS
mgnify:CR=1 FL=1|tara:strand:- start:4 stop:444 length:441 start_codon:yes stop_codon:yes gene_type:complete